MIQWKQIALDPSPSIEHTPPTDGRTLRIALDVRTWSMSGLGTYVQHLLDGFADQALPVEWTLIGPTHLRDRMPANLAIRRWIHNDRPLYSLPSYARYPDCGSVQLFHYPHYNLPRHHAPRTLVSVFDLFHLEYGSWLQRRYQAFFLRRLRWRRAHLVTACSRVRRKLIERARLPGDRIHVIPLGPGHRPPAEPPTGNPHLQTLAGTPLEPPWLLALGIDQPHKNMGFLISALGLYYQRRPEAPPLVWAGLAPEDARRWVARLPAYIRQRVLLEPRVDSDRLEQLFAGAHTLLFPSLDEGFGLPPLEAMARGIPVLCARREPMTTLLGEAPLYFEPDDSASLWRMLNWLLDMPAGTRRELARLGHQQVVRYDWHRTARETFRLYQRILQPTTDPRSARTRPTAKAQS